jgi:hypothetical protein
MTFTDYLLDSLLLLIVFRQIREARFDRMAVILPLGIAAIVCNSYLHSIPTAGNDLPLIIGFTAVGITLGVISGLATRVRTDGGRYALVKAGWVAAGVWVLGMGFRFAFSIWANNGGGPDLVHFSIAHQITAGSAWTAALVLMAMGEVVCRTGLLMIRSHRAVAASPQSVDEPAFA